MASNRTNPSTLGTKTEIPAAGSGTSSLWVQVSIAILVGLLIVSSRLFLSDMANFKPVASLALFAGFLLSRRYISVIGVISGMFISDCFLGSYSWPIAVSVYACLLLPVLFGKFLRSYKNKRSTGFLMSWLATVIGGSLMFFLLTNVAFWQFTAIYSRDLSGLMECLINGLPFFRNTLTSDMLFSGLLFGSYAFVTQAFAVQSAKPTPSAVCSLHS